MRVCIVAEHASTQFGGEAILPVHYFRFLRSKGVAVWMVVHSRTQTEMENLFPDDRSRIYFIPDSWLQKLIFHLGRLLPRRVSEASLGLLNQGITQLKQRRVVRDLIRREGIDILHQPIPVSPRFPSLLFGLGVPRVVGPLNGGMQYPLAFRDSESWFSKTAIAGARLFSNLANTLFPGKRNADAVLIANPRTKQALPAGTRGEIIHIPENGVDMNVWQLQGEQTFPTKPRFVFLGRLIDWKRVDIVIRAMRELPSAELEIIGDGGMRGEWQALARSLGVADRITFTGWLPQSECASRIATATALVLPSIYECGGAVVLEAMAMGKPVIATNWGGPADYLDRNCGFLVDPDSYEQLLSGFASAMQQLADSPELALEMGRAGRQKVVADFDWSRKIDEIIAIYSRLLKKSAIRSTSDNVAVSSSSVPEQH
jgi:glycosyltransferase involved in cell wall biosynthesis